MSMRTLIEINHDYLHEIEADPERFLEELCLYIRGVGYHAAERLDRFGARIVNTRHHTDPFTSEDLDRLYRRPPAPEQGGER